MQSLERPAIKYDSHEVTIYINIRIFYKGI